MENHAIYFSVCAIIFFSGMGMSTIPTKAAEVAPLEEKSFQARIGDTYYTLLENALAAAHSGETVELSKARCYL